MHEHRPKTPLKLTVFAATGGIGRHLVEQAVAAGHQVTAVVRDPSRLPIDVPTVTPDLSAVSGATLMSAVAGTDAVLSGLGPRTSAEAGVASGGTSAIVQAMQATAVRRLVVVSAAPIGTVPSPGRPTPPRHDPGDGVVMRHVLAPLLRTALREPYADLARMEDTVRASGLDWTIIRPPRLVDAAGTGAYRTAVDRNVRRGMRIARADVAHLMLRALDDPALVGRTVAIAR